MSAIGGIVAPVGSSVAKQRLNEMLAASVHRGNDTRESWGFKHVGLIHKQLWTTIESQSEIQPLYQELSGLVLTADARLDNRLELMDKLSLPQSAGKLITDADLILNSYLQWAEQCVLHLVGDFAFAIWDIKKNSLFGARDHLGIKPLHYAINNQVLYFSSEISAIFAASDIEKKPNLKELQHYFKFHAISNEATFFEQIKRLLPGHYFTYKDDVLDIHRYWFPETIPIDHDISFDKAKHKLQELLHEAVNARLRSAYDVGCELSGGVDSSSILALAVNSQLTAKITPFSNRYGQLSCDEGEFISSVLDKYQLSAVQSHVHQLDYAKEYSLSSYYQMAPDWPGRGSFLDAKAEMQSAQQRGVRVILTGQGGDHIAAGNDARLTDYFLNADFSHLLAELRSRKFQFKTIRNYLVLPLLPEKIKCHLKIMLGREGDKQFSAVEHNFIDTLNKTQTYMQKREIGLLCGAANQLWMDSNPYTALGGCFDIEYRHPFFDKRVVEFMLSLPVHMKVKQHDNKILLKSAMASLLPKTIYQRQDKAVFDDIIMIQIQQLKKDQQNIMQSTKKGLFFPEFRYNQDVSKIWKSMCIDVWVLKNF